jgi:hypothetical protein
MKWIKTIFSLPFMLICAQSWGLRGIFDLSFGQTTSCLLAITGFWGLVLITIWMAQDD